MLPAQDILVDPGSGAVVACIELSRSQMPAVAHAAGVMRRERFAVERLDADAVLAMRALTVLCDRLAELARTGMHGTVHVTDAEARLLAEAVGAYRLRDTESYQSPEERERLALLDPLAADLLDLVAELRAATDAPVAQPAVAR